MKSNFYLDKKKEEILGRYLDFIYSSLNFNVTRINDLDSQFAGVDLIIRYKSKEYKIDEKAQLDYLNKDLPTFTFELSYLKEYDLKEGWLYDSKKSTEYYFLITGIFIKGETIEEGIEKCKITSVDRKKLIEYLEKKGLTKSELTNLDVEIRKSKLIKNIPLKQLDERKEGCLYLSDNKVEKPLNLKLYLSHLINEKIAKRIYP